MMSWRGLCKGGKHIWTAGAWRPAGTYSRSAFQDHYQVLGIGKEASKSEIKNAFITLSKKCHPDSDPSNPYLHAQFVRINEAYNVLSKPSTRKQYDDILEAIQRNRPSYSNPSPYQKASRAHRTVYTHRKEEDHDWYWSQFPPKSDYNDSPQEREEVIKSLIFGCLTVVCTTMFLHFFVFRSLRDLHNKELDEQQKKIMDFYNKTRETALANGDTNQINILLQKHEERLKKLYGREDNTKK